MTIAIDFDGTIVTHNYPYIGEDIGAIPVIKSLQENCKIILLTMRFGRQLTDAVKFCREQGIHLYGINENPSQSSWNKSRKVYANYYIDDLALGTPLIFDHKISNKPFVDFTIEL